MNVRPLHDRIIVHRLEEGEQQIGGIIIPDTAKEKPQQGTVIAVGNGKVNDDGKRIPLDVNTGDRILFGKYSGQEITSPLRSEPLAALLQRVRDQYRETPGLELTKPQATRLFGVAPSVCAAMLRALVMENFLSRAGDGLFVRSTTY